MNKHHTYYLNCEEAPQQIYKHKYYMNGAFPSSGGGTIETVYGTNSITLTNAKANSLKALTLFGGTEQDGTPTPTTPVDIVCNNGAIKYSANMANVNAQTVLLGYYISAQGVKTADANNWIYQDFIPVKPNTTYTLSLSSSVYFVSISEYSTTDDNGFIVRKTGGTGSNTQLTITTGATTNFIRFGTNIDRTEITLEEVLAINWMLNEGSTAIPYAPYVEGGIYTDGTVETVGVNLSDNLIDGQGTFVSPSASTTTRIYKAFGKLKAGIYHISISNGFEFIFQYKDTLEGTPTTYGNIGTWASDEEFEITDTSMFYGITIRNEGGSGNIYPSTFYNADGKILFYLTDEEATVEMLLNVGDYKDTQEVLSGSVTRNVGIKVFDGSENFGTSNATFTYAVSDRVTTKTQLICSHFEYSTKTSSQVDDLKIISFSSSNIGFRYDACANTTEFKAWLAEQYNAGTPVIIVYPLATPTTETVTGQHLSTKEGTNTISITQASISSLDLEAKYKKGK